MINFNELTWKAPTHNGRIGYIPSDKYYNDIVEWLKTGRKIWVEKTKYADGTKVIKSRVHFENSRYDVIVDYIPETKMIAYTFREQNTYEV